MFVLNRDLFRDVDFDRTSQFVECWERYYGDEDHAYFTSLNIGKDLTEDNIVQLLRWKDPRMLTHPKMEGEPNPRVTRVLDQLSTLNAFRNDTISVDEFQKITFGLFPAGFIWPLFLCHISRPTEWPIADQHVFRAYSVLFDAAIPDSIASFESYRRAFHDLSDRLRGTDMTTDPAFVVRTNKRLDNALFAFGQFLATYDR